MSQYPPDPNYNPYGQPPSDPNYNQGTAYGGPPSGAGQNPYNPYTNNPSAPDTNPSPYGPYGQNPPTPTPPPPYNPYDPTVSNSNPNYSPYAPMPPAPPTPSRKGPSMRVILIAVIALVLVVGGIAFGLVSYKNNQQNNANGTATAQANITATAHANASATAQAAMTATAIASNYPFSANLKLSDPLTNNSKGSGWQTDNLCKFQGNAYHATDTQANTFTSCSAVNTNFSNFTFEVEAVLNSGDGIGLTFRGNSDKSQFYRLAIYTDGSYAVYLYVDTSGTNSRKLTNGNITPTPDLTNTNTISVVARGSTMTIYFNKTEVTSFSDPTYSSGQIGVAATDISKSADAVFTNLNVWALP